MKCPHCGKSSDRPSTGDRATALALLDEEADRANVDRFEARSSRTKGPTLVRWRVWRELRRMGWSYPRIARAFGVDHTTVMHAVRRAAPCETNAPTGAA